MLTKKIIFIAITSLLVCAACSSYSPDTEQSELTLTSQPWQMVSIDNQKATMGENNKPVTLEFTNDTMRYQGFAGCNNYSGRFEIEQQSLELGPAMATRKMCQQGSKIESLYFKALSAVDSFQLQARTLTLYDKNGKILLTFNSK